MAVGSESNRAVKICSWGLTGELWPAATDGSGAVGAASPAIFRGGEVANGQKILKVVASVCSVTSFASRNDSYRRMEMAAFGELRREITGDSVT
jgi:hypothetical protein